MRSYEEAVQLILFESGEIPRLKKARKAIETSGAADKVDKIDDLDGQIELHKRKRIDVADRPGGVPASLHGVRSLDRKIPPIGRQKHPAESDVHLASRRPPRASSHVPARLRGITGS